MRRERFVPKIAVLVALVAYEYLSHGGEAAGTVHQTLFSRNVLQNTSWYATVYHSYASYSAAEPGSAK